jgi:sporulation protein YlmC with PRC-barrel domain
MKIRALVLATIATAAIGLPVLAQSTMPAPGTPAPASPAPASPAPASPMTSSPMTSSDMFYSEAITPANWRASEAMGLAVYNRGGERIGEIDDMVLDGSGRVTAAVIGVGGFLGMGERKVAVTFRSFEMTRDANGAPRMVVNLSKTTLQSAPEYKATAPAKRS